MYVCTVTAIFSYPYKVPYMNRRSQSINAFEFLTRAIYSIVSNNRVIRDCIFDCDHHYLLNPC